MKSQTSFDQKTVLTLLDVCGSCVVDVFYNHLYDRAIAVHEKTSAGLTECYRQTVTEYVNEINTPRFYTVLLNSLHHYVRMSTIYNDISYPDCITLYTSLFVPHMYVASLTAEQKINFLSMVVGNVVLKFNEELMVQHIGCVIDDHSDPINIEILQDSILKILLSERDTSYKRFIESQKPKKKQINKNATSTTKIQPQVLAKLTNAFKKSITERVALKKKNATLSKKNRDLSNRFKEIKTMFLDQIDMQKKQSMLIQDLQNKLENMKTNAQEKIAKAIIPMYEKPAEYTPTKFDEPLIEDNSPSADTFDDDLFSVQYVES